MIIFIDYLRSLTKEKKTILDYFYLVAALMWQQFYRNYVQRGFRFLRERCLYYNLGIILPAIFHSGVQVYIYWLFTVATQYS